MTADVIDQLVGIQPGDALDSLRDQRPNARANAQASYDALLRSSELTEVAQRERLAIAYWTVALSKSPPRGSTATSWPPRMLACSPHWRARCPAR